MEFVSPITYVATWLGSFTSKHAMYIYNLEENLESLRNQTDELINLSLEVTRRVERAEQQRMTRTVQVNGWLQRVHDLDTEVEVILRKGDRELQKKCFLSRFPRNCYSSYKLGKKISKMLIAVSQSITDLNFDVVAYQLPHPPVDEIPVENNTVGLDSLLEEVWSCLEDIDVSIIGLYGIGGVGKTTLLKKINNVLLNRSHNFDVVIWVVASKEVNMEKIQEVILKKLEIADHIWARKSEEQRATEILRVLRTKKFMLMIDDIWERIDLVNMGIPPPDHQNESKVVFTSRSRDVCGLMEAQRRIKVGCLAREEAINLFQMKVGEETLKSHPDIPKLAKVVAEECEGLPLALVTIGRAMRSRKTPEEWDHAISVLQSYPSEFSGIGDQVFPVLRFSYDSLSCERDRNCFLYCSVFREDYNIRKEELINLWIGEGLLDECRDYIHDALNLGEYVVGTLKLACLLESDESEEFVRMHDMIRDMALWVANSSGRDRSKILVLQGKSTEAHRFGIQANAERISVWGHHGNIESFIRESFCPVSLFLKDAMLNSLPNGFFQYMHALKVLDLSGNRSLTILPESIGELIDLQYLNLSETAIRELPLELKNLKKLKTLLLNYTKYLRNIPRGVILSLSQLQVFSMIIDEFSSSGLLYDEHGLLVELESLDNLGDVRITIGTERGATKLLGSPMLQKSIKKLSFNHLWDMKCLTISTYSMDIMMHLVKLEIMFCKSLQEFKILKNTSITRHHYFQSLHEVVIWECDLLDATWLIYAPSLQKLTIADCALMATVIRDKFPDAGIEHVQIFSSLQTLNLQELPMLGSICPQALTFPALIEIHVDKCEFLQKLPLNAISASGLQQITGTASWWNQLLWEDKAIENAFMSKFIEIPNYE